LAEEFQRRRLKCEKLTDNIWRTPSDGKSSLCFWQGELKRTKRQTTIYQTLHITQIIKHKTKDQVTRTSLGVKPIIKFFNIFY
jgi:hypothetical protein